jgi:hypothetical protein
MAPNQRATVSGLRSAGTSSSMLDIRACRNCVTVSAEAI